MKHSFFLKSNNIYEKNNKNIILKKSRLKLCLKKLSMFPNRVYMKASVKKNSPNEIRWYFIKLTYVLNPSKPKPNPLSLSLHWSVSK